jgi:hypothetical protein
VQDSDTGLDIRIRGHDGIADSWRKIPTEGSTKRQVLLVIASFAAVFRHFLHLARPL